MALVYVTREIVGDAMGRLRAAHDVVVRGKPEPAQPEELRAAVSDAEGLLCMLTDRVDQELLDAAPRLLAIANYAVGYDNIDLAATTARGIAVGVTPDVLTDATADLAFALLLAAARNLPEAIAVVAAGQWSTWEPTRWLGSDVQGATLGIVGFGRIGRAVARRAEGFDMTVLATHETPLEELLARSDFVTLHCPLTPATRHLIDARALSLMKPTAILVNTARGAIVDQLALGAALRAGTIGGAALDVTDPEPMPPDDPLRGAPNLIVVPHIGSATYTARARMTELAVNNLLAALAGRPMPNPAR
jgi:lactate dehydrogenase-like 2-hydroxyacid dehydrogenase